ncbi:MAG: hypothetical protein ABIJ18_01440 [archaeon]
MYVLSKSEFKTQKGALKKIQHWEDTNSLDNPPPNIYEVIRKIEVKKEWRVK